MASKYFKMTDHEILICVAQAQDESRQDQIENKRELNNHSEKITTIMAICKERNSIGLACPSTIVYNKGHIAAAATIGGLGLTVLYGITKLIFGHYGVSI